MPWPARLKRRFSPRLLRLGVDGARPLPGGGTSGVLALVGRELCLFLRVDATRIPARQRPGFVALAVRRAAPFADPEHDVFWRDGHAAVWYWSRERTRALAADAGDDVRFRAEPMFRGEPAVGDAVELLALDAADVSQPASAGVEARVWRQGQLVADRWWAQPPDAAAWRDFARGSGLDPSHASPAPADAPLRATALSAAGQRLALSGRLEMHRPLATAAAATLVAALLAWQLASIARVDWETRQVTGRIEQLSEQLARIIDARERADQAQAQMETLLALRAPASQVRMLGEVKRLTPGTWKLMNWTQPSPDTLEVRFKMANADVPAIVAAWEDSGLFEDVAPAGSTRPDEVTLQATLTPMMDRAVAPSLEQAE